MIENGADLNQVSTRYGHTPLTVMVDYRLHKDTKSAMRLISIMPERGADPNIPVGPTRSYNRDWVGSTALHKAVEIGYRPLVRMLLENGADPDIVPPVTDIESFAPLHRAVWKRDFEMVKLLLANGADSNIRQYKGSTYSGRVPLLTAILAESPTMVQILLDGGADPNIRVDYENRTLLYNAVLVENKAIVKILLEGGADPNVAGESEYHLTPLISAIVKPPMKTIIHLLLEHGADPDMKDKTGSTALTLTANG